MKAAYCEIKRGRNCVTVNYYSKEGYGLELGCRKLERERREAYAAKRRRLNRIRENIGAGVGMLGFLLLLCAGGTEEISVIVMTGAAGLVLMVLAAGWAMRSTARRKMQSGCAGCGNGEKWNDRGTRGHPPAGNRKRAGKPLERKRPGLCHPS